MIPRNLIFLDLETTGTNASRDRVTEVGLCEMVDGQVVAEWSTLVNPETAISPFIQQLTGITAGMVADAPRFVEIADELQGRLSDKVMVAHNARFDYGFLKSEFRRLGIDFRQRVLCTLKLSRALFPQFSKHNLSALIERHDLTATDRHRALGDARATQQFFARVTREKSSESIAEAIQKQLKNQSLPPHLASEEIERLPSSPGVYLFYGDNDSLLYVGKSVDIRSRVKSHFSGDHRAHKGMRLSQQVRRIDHVETAGELGALLLEARLIKERAPIHNRQLRRTRDLFTIRLDPDRAGSNPQIVSFRALQGERLEGLFGIFRSRRKADEALRDIVRDHGFCNRALGLEKGQGACFNYQVKKCRGACVGKEPLPLHEARFINALADLKVRSWPFDGPVGIKETSPDGGRSEVHVFDQWCLLGTADSDERLREILAASSAHSFDLDSYKILNRFLGRKNHNVNLIELRPEHCTL